MSWQSYVDQMIVGSGKCSGGCIMGKGDGRCWAGSTGFYPRAYNAMVTNEDGTESKMEINESRAMQKYAVALQKPVEGLRMNGTKYTPLRTLENGVNEDGLQTIYFKEPGGGGCMCVTNQCIVVGVFDEMQGQTAADCNDAVETLARHLKSSGF